MESKEKREAAKDYLKQLRRMDERIQEQKEIVEELRDRLTLPARNLCEPVQGSRRHDTFEQKMVLSLDKQMQLEDLIFDYEKLRDDALMMLLSMYDEDALFTKALYKVYFQYMNHEDAAKDLGISCQYLRHLLPKALEAFYDECLDKPGRAFKPWMPSVSGHIPAAS